MAVAVRDYLEGKGYQVGWDPNTKSVTASLNGQTTSFKPTTNVGGKTYADQSQLDQIVARLSPQPVISKPDAWSRDLMATVGDRSGMLEVTPTTTGADLDALVQRLSQPIAPPTPPPPPTSQAPSGVVDAINQAAGVSPQFNPQQQYTDPKFIQDLVTKLVGIMEPATYATKRNLNQSYDLGNQRMLENLNARGVLSGDIGQGDIDRYERERQQSLIDLDAQTQSQALAQALNFAQLPMQEREMLFNEFSTNRGFDASQLWNKAGMLQDQYNTDRGFGLDLGALLGTYNGTPTLAGQNQAFNQDMANRQFDYGVSRDTVADQRYEDEFAYQQARDKITDAQDKRNFDEDVRRFGLDYALSRQRAYSGGGSSTPSVSQQNLDIKNQAAEQITNRISVFRTVADFNAQLQREVAAGQLSPTLYAAVKDLLYDNFGNEKNWNTVLPTWQSKTPQTKTTQTPNGELSNDKILEMTK